MNIRNLLLLLFLLSKFVNSQDIRLELASMSFDIKKNIKTKLEILNSDSISLYTIYENLIERDITVLLVRQPVVFELSDYIKNTIYIPTPILDTGIYLIKYSTNDTLYLRKFFYIK